MEELKIVGIVFSVVIAVLLFIGGVATIATFANVHSDTHNFETCMMHHIKEVNDNCKTALEADLSVLDRKNKK